MEPVKKPTNVVPPVNVMPIPNVPAVISHYPHPVMCCPYPAPHYYHAHHNAYAYHHHHHHPCHPYGWHDEWLLRGKRK